MSEDQKTSVLFVDDNQHIRSIVHAMLNSLGIYDIEEACHADAAHEALKTKSSHVVLVSDQAKTVDGVGFVSLVRESTEVIDPKVPIILMTSTSDKAQIAEVVDAGASAVLVRPFAAQDLKDRITEVQTDSIPLVRTTDYFGADRRASSAQSYWGAERRGLKRLMGFFRTGTRG